MRERSSDVPAPSRPRKVTLYVAVSLDGYISPCAGASMAFPPDLSNDPGHAEFLAGIDTLVMGRKTYDQVRASPLWPGVGRRCVVLSRTRAGQRESGVEFVAGDVADIVSEVRAAPGRGIWILGGAEIVAPCLAGGVLEEIIVSIAPVLLGEGTPLFLPIARSTPLRLREWQGPSGGRVRLTYEVAR